MNKPCFYEEFKIKNYKVKQSLERAKLLSTSHVEFLLKWNVFDGCVMASGRISKEWDVVTIKGKFVHVQSLMIHCWSEKLLFLSIILALLVKFIYLSLDILSMFLCCWLSHKQQWGSRCEQIHVILIIHWWFLLTLQATTVVFLLLSAQWIHIPISGVSLIVFNLIIDIISLSKVFII